MTRPTTVFYVYADTDEELRQQLEKHLALLQRQGVLASWQESQAGAVWEQEREQTFNKASLILLLVSADFVASDVCYKEQMLRALERQKRGEVQVLPILVRPVEVTNAPFTDLPMVPTNGLAVTLWNNQDAAWTHITEGIRCVLEDKPLPVIQEKTETAGYTTENQQASYGQTIGEHNEIHQYYSLSASPPPVPTAALVKPIWMVPYARNPFFTGRDVVLENLHQRFERGQAQAVSQSQAMSGLGGIGKTQIAVEYAYRYQQEYQQVLWASAETAESLTTGYTQIAAKLELPEKEAQDQTVMIQAVKAWLGERQHWLLILDNADEPEVLEAFLPPSVGGQVLVTTRASDLTALGLGFGPGLEIETFTAEQGAAFVLHRAGLLALESSLDQARPEDRRQAMQLSEELGGLALALDQAGAYLRQTRRDLASYLQLYQKQRARLLKERRGKEHPLPVASTWQLSFERVEATNPAAAEVLRVCSFLAPDTIPEELLEAGATHLGPILAPVLSDGYLLDQAVGVLRGYSLLKRDPETKMLSVHRLVQVVLKDGMEDAQRREWIERVVRAVAKSVPSVKYKNWRQWERMVVQALVCAEEMKLYEVAFREAISLLQQTEWYLMERGRYREAQNLLVQVLHMSKQQQGRVHFETVREVAALSVLYKKQGEYAEAKPLYKRALEISEQELGSGHPETVISLNNLAVLYQKQGKYFEAERWYMRALKISEQPSEPRHPSIAVSLNNLAVLYSAQEKYSEAKQLHTRALAIREQLLGLEHPDTAKSLNNLAVLYQDQGEYFEAERLHTRALEIVEESLGPGHPEMAVSLNNLGVLYSAQGKYSEAEPLLIRALAICEQSLGSGHSETATSLNNLAAFYQKQGKYSKSELLYRRALEIEREMYGIDHPDVAKDISNLAVLCFVQGKYREAEPLLIRALAICEQELGLEHPDTANSLNNLAALYRAQEKYAEAEPLLVRALAILEQSLGAAHPTTRIGHSNYAVLLRALGREEEAAALEAGSE